jgi:hypothetical protein
LVQGKVGSGGRRGRDQVGQTPALPQQGNSISNACRLEGARSHHSTFDDAFDLRAAMIEQAEAIRVSTLFRRAVIAMLAPIPTKPPPIEDARSSAENSAFSWRLVDGASHLAPRMAGRSSIPPRRRR